MNRREVVEALRRRIWACSYQVSIGVWPPDIMTVEEGRDEWDMTPDDVAGYNAEQLKRDPQGEYDVQVREWEALRFLFDQIGVHLPGAEEVHHNMAGWLGPEFTVELDIEED